MSAEILREAAKVLRERTRCEDCHNTQRYDDALADWLDNEASNVECYPEDIADCDCPESYAYRVARLILGGAS